MPVDARVDGCTRDQVGEFVVVGIRAAVGVSVAVGAFVDICFVESLGQRNTSHAVMVKAGG